MKKTLLVSFLFLVTSAVFSQSQKTDKNFNKGVKAFQSGNYTDAINYFSNSIHESPTSNSYYNRAIAYANTGDSCRFCADLESATEMDHTEAQTLYKEYCIKLSVNYFIPDSLKKKFPELNRFETYKEKCANDSTIVAIFVKGNETWARNISDVYEEIYDKADIMPQFYGGENARNQFIATNIVYPFAATEYGIQGTVFVTFIVEKDGSVTNVKVIRGIGGGCDEESVRIIKLMPNWIPAKHAGKAVRFRFTMPIYYRLQR